MFVTGQPSRVYLVWLVGLVRLVCLVRRLQAPQSSVLSPEIPALSTQHSALGPKPSVLSLQFSALDRGSASPLTFHPSPFTP